MARVTGGEVALLEAVVARGFRYGMDSTGREAVIAALVEGIGGCGVLGLVGIGRGGAVVDPVALVEREITVVGCHAFGGELAEVNAMLPDLAGVLDDFVAETILPGAVPDAYARHIAGEVSGLKTIILCGGVA
ncbi:hypothetical protein [Paragemmobacter aquarius]|uniref:hypothetical protein n=1 Tax=Paragemmobacter aquarius TaxID=2169400 RepID=UPI001E2E9D7F|nr:hypothetical protein [Gemmobacter aquarius]